MKQNLYKNNISIKWYEGFFICVCVFNIREIKFYNRKTLQFLQNVF